MAEDWVVLDEVAGMLQAEMISGLLEAQEIPTVLSQEGAGKAIGLTIGMLGSVQILIPSKDLDRAQELLDAYYAAPGARSSAENAEESGEESES